MGLYVGVNGCSLKTKENVGIVEKIPLDRIMLETDCPYCEIRNTHACSKDIKTKFSQQKASETKHDFGKMVKGRNEPCTMI